MSLLSVKDAAKEIGVTAKAFKEKAKEEDLPGVHKLGEKEFAIESASIEALKEVFKSKPEEEKEPEEETKSFIELRSIMLTISKKLDERQKLPLEFEELKTLQNSFSMMQNRIVDIYQEISEVNQRNKRIETKLHNFIEKFIETHVDAEKKAKFSDIIKKKDIHLASQRIKEKWELN